MKRSATHATFTIERLYRVPVARVFNAFSDPDAKAQWFIGGDGWKEIRREDDFRVDGRERLTGRSADGTITDYESRYEEIVPDERIVYTYHMSHDEKKLSISLATIQFEQLASGTKLTLTEQMTCLDGYDDVDGRDRKQGVTQHLNRVDELLQRITAGSN